MATGAQWSGSMPRHPPGRALDRRWLRSSSTSTTCRSTPQDGTACGIRIPSAHVEHLIYHAAQDAWIGRAALDRCASTRTRASRSAATPPSGRYPGDLGELPATEVHRTPTAVPDPPGPPRRRAVGRRAAAAGAPAPARCKSTRTTAPLATATRGDLALSWYPLADGDDFLSPAAFNHGVRRRDLSTGPRPQLTGTVSSGWQNSPTFDTEPAVDDHLYPEIYVARARDQCARVHRPAPLGGRRRRRRRVGGGPMSGYPIDRMFGWYRAEQISVADDDHRRRVGRHLRLRASR